MAFSKSEKNSIIIDSVAVLMGNTSINRKKPQSCFSRRSCLTGSCKIFSTKMGYTPLKEMIPE